MTAEYHPGSDRVVCIVDDDPSVRSALERLLRCEGLVVRTFASAEEFLGEDLEDKCGCVIADVHLGRMTGLELQATLALRPSSMPVILTSGVADAFYSTQQMQGYCSVLVISTATGPGQHARGQFSAGVDRALDAGGTPLHLLTNGSYDVVYIPPAL